MRVSAGQGNIFGGTREGIEALHQDVGQPEKAGTSRLFGGVVLMELAENFGGDDFAEGSASAADALVFGGGLLLEELETVGQEAVY
jgi:hypothetical protein